MQMNLRAGVMVAAFSAAAMVTTPSLAGTLTGSSGEPRIVHALGATPSVAGTLIVGGPGDPGAGNSFPFGSTSWEPEYQQVYASSDFPGTMTIGDLEFYNHNFTPGVANGLGTYDIYLSATSAPVNGLNLSNLGANLGPDNTLVFAGSLPAIVGGVLDIPLSTHFTYNPASGNLLLWVHSSDAAGGDVFLDARMGTAAGLFSRAMTPGCCIGTSDWGLVTGFSVIPEPATWAMMLLGFAGLGFLGYRQTQRAKPQAA